MMTPGLRRFTFTTHITSSVGWVGAALAFLALAVIRFTGQRVQWTLAARRLGFTWLGQSRSLSRCS